MTYMEQEQRWAAAHAEFIDAVREADDVTCKAALAVMKRMISARKAGETVEYATALGWFEEERARVLWPYPE